MAMNIKAHAGREQVADLHRLLSTQHALTAAAAAAVDGDVGAVRPAARAAPPSCQSVAAVRSPLRRACAATRRTQTRSRKLRSFGTRAPAARERCAPFPRKSGGAELARNAAAALTRPTPPQLAAVPAPRPLGLKLDLAQLGAVKRTASGATGAQADAARPSGPSRSGGSSLDGGAPSGSGSGASGGRCGAPSGGASTGGGLTPRPGAATASLRPALFPQPLHGAAAAMLPPPPPLSAAAAARDPFLVAAAGAAAAGRAWGEGAERVALLGRRWYATADYPSAQGAPGPPQASHDDVSERRSGGAPGAFTKPPRLMLRPDGTTAPAEGGDDDVAHAEAAARKPARPRAPRAMSAAAAASGARAAPTGGSGAPAVAQAGGEAASARWGAGPAAVAAALLPPPHWPALPAATLSALMQVPMSLPPAAARRALAPEADAIAAAAAARVPTAPRSRPAKRPSDAAFAVAEAEAAPPANANPGGPAAELARVLALARRPSNRARDGGRVPGPGAGLPFLAPRAVGAKALPPSFAFEVLPRLVPLSRGDVAADLKAIADGAEALFCMRADGGAKRMRAA
jgi:hypothetical protein